MREYKKSTPVLPQVVAPKQQSTSVPFVDQRNNYSLQLKQQALMRKSACRTHNAPAASPKTNSSSGATDIAQMKVYDKSVNLIPEKKGGYNNINEITTEGTDPKSQARDLRDTLNTLFDDDRAFTGAHMIPQRLGGSGDDTNCRPWLSAFEDTWNKSFDNNASMAQAQIKAEDEQSRKTKRKLKPLSFSYKVETDDATTGDAYHLLLSKGFTASGSEAGRAQLQIHASRLDAIPRAVQGHYKTVESGGKSVEYKFAKSEEPWESLNIDKRSGLGKWWTSLQLNLGMIPRTAYDTLAPDLSIERDISPEARENLGTHVYDDLNYRATGGKNRHVAKPTQK